MDAEQKKSLVRDFLTAMQSGNADAALALTTGEPSFRVFNNEMPGGLRGFCSFIPTLFKEGPHRVFTGQWVDGDTVISQLTITGTTSKDTAYENYYIIICRLDGGKVAALQEYMDTANANKAFGFGG